MTVHAGEGADQLLQVVLYGVDGSAEHQAGHEGEHEPPAPLGQQTGQHQHHAAPGPLVEWTDNKQASSYGSSDARSYVVTGHLGHDWSKVWILNIDPRSSSFTLVPGNCVSEVLLVNQSVWVEVEATAAAGVSLMACAARIVTRTQEVTFGKGSPGKKEMGDIEVDENPIDRPQHEAHPSGTQEPPDKTAENIAAN